MEQEKFQDLLLMQVARLTEQVHELVEGLQSVKEQLQAVTDKQIRAEHDAKERFGALFDAFNLRGDQILQLQEHLDDKLYQMSEDINYLVRKTARQESDLLELKRAR